MSVPPGGRHPFYPSSEDQWRTALEHARAQQQRSRPTQPEPTNEIPVWAGQPPVEPLSDEVHELHREQKSLTRLILATLIVQILNLILLFYLLFH